LANLMPDNGADIRFTQQMLGHVSIGTTEIYTHVSIVKLKQILDMTHPDHAQET
jgi:integrase/recombinase XerD